MLYFFASERYTVRMKNVTLIGMPSAGKSTVGVVLAKLTGRRFIDTDLLLQEQYGGRLPELIRRLGVEGFIAAESALLAGLFADNSVIATGGSAVYGEAGMRQLREISTVVYLSARPELLEKRLGAFDRRGVVTLGARTVAELYAERAPLYERYADVTVPDEGIEQTARRIAQLTDGSSGR